MEYTSETEHRLMTIAIDGIFFKIWYTIITFLVRQI
jgi:hypothetical protein